MVEEELPIVEQQETHEKMLETGGPSMINQEKQLVVDTSLEITQDGEIALV